MFSYRSLPHRKEGVSTRAPSLGRGCRAQRGGVGFLFCGEAAFSLPSPLGKGDRAAVDRVLSYIVDLRRSPSLFFIPPEPYPARSARHLPHAGKALSVAILFLHISCIRFDNMGIAVSSYRSLPHWGRGTAPAVDRVLSYIVDLRRISPLSFIPLVPYPARFARHLPHAGKALSIVIVFPTYPVFALTM